MNPQRPAVVIKGLRQARILPAKGKQTTWLATGYDFMHPERKETFTFKTLKSKRRG